MSVALEKIPAGLRENGRFCLNKLEMKPGNIRPDKVPYRTDGTRASPSDPNDFSDFDIVSSIYQKGGYDGIGIGVFDDMVAIDIDHCIKDGQLNNFAKSVIRTLQSYTEISISGTGIHIFIRAPGLKFDKKRYYFNNRNRGIEIYPAGFTKRFIATTGDTIQDFDIEERTEAIQELLEDVMLRPKAKKEKKKSEEPPGSYLSDETIMEKIFSTANGKKAGLCGMVITMASLPVRVIWLFAIFSHFGVAEMQSRWTDYFVRLQGYVANGMRYTEQKPMEI